MELVGIICNKFTELLYGSDAYSEGVQQQGLGEEYLDPRDNVTGR